LGDVSQADGNSGYSQGRKTTSVIRIGCSNHARRKFVEASRPSQTKAPTKRRDNRCRIEQNRKLYAIEKSIKEVDGDKKNRHDSRSAYWFSMI